MKAQEIRNRFSHFFIKHQHEKHKSSSLVPYNDNTILFANAGMNQFKDYFTGKATPPQPRAVTIQKCVRAGGKHNDLENVGFTARHHTFFEMLGNFSFGDYFKKEAIDFAWKFLTEECKIPKEKLYVTVHESDDEALNIWHKDHGIPLEKIFKMGDKTNFWEMGDVGPCGPCTEIFFDHGEKYSTGIPAGGCLVDDEGRYVEIWNLVFMQFEKRFEGAEIKRFSLPKPSVDTGAGLERVAAVLQGKYYNYDTDIFEPIIRTLTKLTGKSYSDEKVQSTFRIVADHIRASTMLITDGVIPSNEGRGYVLRRIIRRAVRHLSLLGIKEVSFYKLVPAVFESLGEEYPDNMANALLAEKLLKLEEEKFRTTLENGLQLMNEELKHLKPNEKFKGDVAFKLYDTFGFPLDLTEVILREKNIQLDIDGFNTSMQTQKETSKKSAKFKVKEDNAKLFYTIKEKFGETDFTGYSELKTKAKLLEKIELDDITYLIFNKTPFYAESGGQVGDTGKILSVEGPIATIQDTIKPVDGLFVHISKDADLLKVGEEYTLGVDETTRQLTMKNHSATHLLQAALGKVLGLHVKQAGSSVGPDRLRFDFTHSEAMSSIEISKVEELVNLEIEKNSPVSSEVMSKDEASKKGAMALFGEKYGERVRVIGMGNFSCELCGGTHVNRTGEINLFKIIIETSVASGVRRIEALTGPAALGYLQKRSNLLAEVEKLVSVKEEKAVEKVVSLQNEVREKMKNIDHLQTKIQQFESESLFNNHLKTKNGMSLTIANTKESDVGAIRKLSEIYTEKFPQGILFIYNITSDKVNFIFKTSRTNTKVDCSAILKPLLPLINGKGGGKADTIQGSGESHGIETLIKKLKEVVDEI